MTDTPTIRHDRDWRGYRAGDSVVTTCTSCGPRWANLATSERAARIAGEDHLIAVHGVEGRRARNARHVAASRARARDTPADTRARA